MYEFYACIRFSIAINWFAFSMQQQLEKKKKEKKNVVNNEMHE